MITLKYTPIDPRKLETGIQQALDSTAEELAAKFRQQSPVGVTGELRDNWRTTSKRFEATIRNDSDQAFQRVVGRGPGKFPAYGESTPLGKWARLKGIPAFLVARKISREGTERWKEQRNFAGLDREGNPYRGGAIDQARDELARKLRNIKVT